MSSAQIQQHACYCENRCAACITCIYKGHGMRAGSTTPHLNLSPDPTPWAVLRWEPRYGAKLPAAHSAQAAHGQFLQSAR